MIRNLETFFERRVDETSSWEIGLIDFQWTGIGLGGTDVGHFMCASVAPEGLSADGSAEARSSMSTTARSAKPQPSSGRFRVSKTPEKNELLTREELQVQYENGVLDTIAMASSAYQWLRVKASPESLAKNAMSIGRNSYNKSLPNALWMIRSAICT